MVVQHLAPMAAILVLLLLSAGSVKALSVREPRGGWSPPTRWSAKIVTTIGPASENRLEQMLKAGMDVCRLNFSHGSYENHQANFDKIRNLADVAILCDIQGPKIRTGVMKEPFHLGQDDIVRVTPDDVVGTKERFQIKYQTLLQDLYRDDVIFINDGIVKLIVVDQDGRDLVCQCVNAGTVSDNKGCNMPSGNLSVNVVTPKDEQDLEFIAKLNPEYVATSFVSCARDIEQVRACLALHGNTEIKIVAKIERPVALQNLEEIVDASDAVMVARGDLGVEIDIWDVPWWQKSIVTLCNRESKPVILATQMLESMCQNSRPTRAEASDVYNAVLDGADAVMLSGESSVGEYPVASVKVMDELVNVAQENMPKRNLDDYDSSSQGLTESVCHGACEIASEAVDLNLKGKLVVVTKSGRAARLISKYRPAFPILAFSETLRTVRELALVWGVRAYHVPEIHDLPLEERVIKAIEVARRIGYLEPDDRYVGVLSASNYTPLGFFTGVYDVDQLVKMNLV